jgi:hypothetical protein
MSSFSNFMFGGQSPDQYKQFSTQTQGQENVFNQLLGGLQGGSQDLFKMLQQYMSGDPEAMKAFEQPAMRQFSEQIVPQLAEKFSGMGAQRSSAFGQEMGGAAAGLAERLQQMRSGLGMDAGQMFGNLLGKGLDTKAFQGFYTPGQYQPGFLNSAAGGFGKALGMGATGAAGSLFDWIKKKMS